jgi:mRNA interferase RelE/StbE
LKYKLAYTHRASRDIRKLEENVKKRIGKALKKYEEEPLKYASKLTDPVL